MLPAQLAKQAELHKKARKDKMVTPILPCTTSGLIMTKDVLAEITRQKQLREAATVDKENKAAKRAENKTDREVEVANLGATLLAKLRASAPEKVTAAINALKVDDLVAVLKTLKLPTMNATDKKKQLKQAALRAAVAGALSPALPAAPASLPASSPAAA